MLIRRLKDAILLLHTQVRRRKQFRPILAQFPNFTSTDSVCSYNVSLLAIKNECQIKLFTRLEFSILRFNSYLMNIYGDNLLLVNICTNSLLCFSLISRYFKPDFVNIYLDWFYLCIMNTADTL